MHRAVALVLLLLPGLLAGQRQEHSANSRKLQFQVGGYAIGLVTRATPAVAGEALTEAYLTQPNLFAHAATGALSARITLNFEGLTLEDGELNAGTWGEGFYDKRHPHTYVHEAVIALEAARGPVALSLSAGRGFAPFGSDDPMVRPLVKFPANHHLAQILERLIVIGGARAGPVVLEAGLFNGDEPIDSKSLGELDNFGNSWAARLTVLAGAAYELQASYAAVESPEHHYGGGFDQRKWSVSVRHERSTGRHPHYLLIEWARTGERSKAVEVVALNSILGEAAVRSGAWTVAARLERTVRPEDERTGSIFRSPWPHIDEQIYGLTRWINASANLSRNIQFGRLSLEPLLEVGHQRPRARLERTPFAPEELYGSDRLWSFSIGARVAAGLPHARMGRYGVALPRPHAH